MRVEDVVQWVVLGEAFIYDKQKFPYLVGLDIAVPYRVVPVDLSFLGFAFSRCPPCWWIEFKLVVVASFFRGVITL